MTDFLLNIGGRDEQQDACNVFKNKSSTLLALGDGMGGHSGGKVASETLIAEAKYAYSRHQGIIKNPKEFFQGIVDGTMSALTQYKEENPESDPHTTCVLALIQNNKLFVGHIGDSRMYLFINKKFEKRSRDHSVVQMLLNEGEITEEEMATHPDQNKLLKSISTRKEVKITVKEYDLPADKSNAVLICSDGFWEQITTDEMQSQLFKKPLKEALTTMVNTAKVRGGNEGDNISVVGYIQKGSILALFHNISKLQNIFISIIISLLIIGGTVYYFTSTGKSKPTKDNNTTQIKEIKPSINPTPLLKGVAKVPVVSDNNQTKVTNNSINKKAIPPVKTDKAISTKSESNESNLTDKPKPFSASLDKNGTIKNEIKEENNASNKNAT